MAEVLELSEAQQSKVKEILVRRQQAARQIWADQTLQGGDRVGRFRGLYDQTVAQIRSILNDEQKKKYDPLAYRQDRPTSLQPSVEDWMKATSKPPH
ncbi:MAG TPA: hypothetical protein VGF08_09905 [Terriglobales bacterium]|jgi:hypothetical protein